MNKLSPFNRYWSIQCPKKICSAYQIDDWIWELLKNISKTDQAVIIINLLSLFIMEGEKAYSSKLSNIYIYEYVFSRSLFAFYVDFFELYWNLWGLDRILKKNKLFKLSVYSKEFKSK